jgi:hypothetical protein
MPASCQTLAWTSFVVRYLPQRQPVLRAPWYLPFLFIYFKDVVKTRIQTQTAESTYRYANGFDAVRQIFHKEGMPGFFRGLSARMLWMAPSSALGIASYQAFKDLLQR